MIILFAFTQKGYRQFIPFMEYYEKKSINYYLFYQGESFNTFQYKVIFGNRYSFYKLLRNEAKRNSYINLICYSIFNVIKLKLLARSIDKKIKIIFRARGIAPEESYLRNNNRFRFFLLSRIEKLALNVSDEVICVTNNQKNHYQKKYKINCEKMFVIHNYLNEWQYEIKGIDLYNNNDYGNEIEIVYSGSFSKWQKIEEIFILVKNLQKFRKEIKFLVCTGSHNNENFQNLAELMNIENFYIENYSEYNKLVERIKRSSVGIILREDNPVNYTASPFKVIDYFVSGIPIIMTNNIGDYDKVLDDKNFVYQFNSNNPVDYIALSKYLDGLANVKYGDIINFCKVTLNFSEELSAYINK